jgi:hypothetical protein
MAEVQLTPGVFRDFRATVQFHLGKIQQDVKKGVVVQFDGTTLKLDGVSHPYPELRSAIREGWLALVGANVSDYVPQSANVQVRAAQAGKGAKQASTAVQQDETYVGQARKPVATTQDGVRVEGKKFNPTLVKDTEGDGRTVGSAIKKAAAVSWDASSDGEPVARIKTATKKSFTVDGTASLNADPMADPDITEVTAHTVVARENDLDLPKEASSLREGQSSEDGAVVANLKTSTRRKVTVTDARSADQEINKLDNAPRRAAPAPVKAKVVTTEKGAVVGISGESVQDVIEAYDNPAGAIAAQKQAQAAAEARRAERLAAFGVKLEPVAEASKVVDVSPPPGAIEADPPKPVEAKPPKSVEDFAVNGDDMELAPGFRWNKKLHWKTRVKTAVTYRDDPEKLALIRGYEAPSVVKQIDAELAK